MIATLVTDGSFCEATRAAAWAAWARSDRGTFLFGAVLEESASGINRVEVKAAALGLKAAIARGIIAPGDHFTWQTDSTYAAGRLAPGYVSRRNKIRKRRGLPIPQLEPGILGRGMFYQLVAANNLTYEIVRSGAGREMGEVDHLARHRMFEERAIRRGLAPQDAMLAAFEEGLEQARREYISGLKRNGGRPV